MEQMMNEMEQMRTQIALLKERLDRERIVSQEVLRRAMRDNVRWLNRQSIVFIVLALVMIPLVFLEAELLSLSKWWCYVTCAFFMFAALYTHLMQSDLNHKDFSDGNLLQTQRAVARFKSMNARWLGFSIPFLVVWCTWLFYETKDNPYFENIIWGFVVGFAIGLPIGIRTYRRMQRTASDILRQIDELTRE